MHEAQGGCEDLSKGASWQECCLRLGGLRPVPWPRGVGRVPLEGRSPRDRKLSRLGGLWPVPRPRGVGRVPQEGRSPHGRNAVSLQLGRYTVGASVTLGTVASVTLGTVASPTLWQGRQPHPLARSCCSTWHELDIWVIKWLVLSGLPF